MIVTGGASPYMFPAVPGLNSEYLDYSTCTRVELHSQHRTPPAPTFPARVKVSIVTMTSAPRVFLFLGLVLCQYGSAFVTPRPSAVLRRAPVRSMVNIPRISLPDQVTDAMTNIDLKNPNELSDEEYNTYSGAAIGGTLIFFLLPGAAVFDLLDAFKDILFLLLKDFAFSAIIGGGLAAYLSLRKDQTADYANQFGSKLLETVDGVIEKIK